MTISSTVSRVAYSGNGSTVAFSVSFKFIDADDLIVYVDDTLQTITTHYTVTGGAGATGTVTFLTAPANGTDVTIIRDVAVLQETDYTENDSFPAETHERALDRLTMIAQRNRDLLDRSLTLADSAPVGVSTALPPPAPNEVIAWNPAGDALTNATVASISTALVGASITRDVFSGTGSQTAFTLSADPMVENNLTVFIGGIFQDSTEWSLSGTTLTFGSAPPAETNNIVCFQSEAITYPVTSLSDGVVTQAKINSDYEATLVKDSELADVLRDGDVGTTAGKLVALDGSAKLPAVDGSQLTSLPAELPAQTGNSGKYLSTDGSSASWDNVQGAKAWVNFNGTLTGTITPRDNFNVSSVTKNGTGDFTLNFASALADANYSVVGSCNQNISTSFGWVFSAPFGQAPTVSSVRIVTSGTGGSKGDMLYTYAAIFGN